MPEANVSWIQQVTNTSRVECTFSYNVENIGQEVFARLTTLAQFEIRWKSLSLKCDSLIGRLFAWFYRQPWVIVGKSDRKTFKVEIAESRGHSGETLVSRLGHSTSF